MKFIMDLGADLDVRDSAGKRAGTVPRYQVHAFRRVVHIDGKPHEQVEPVVIAVGFDLQELKMKYGSETPVHHIDELDIHEGAEIELG